MERMWWARRVAAAVLVMVLAAGVSGDGRREKRDRPEAAERFGAVHWYGTRGKE